MADINDETVSKEAFDRVKAENEKLKASNQELEGKVADLGNTVKDLHKETAVRKALAGKVADPDTVAGLLTPQLRDVEADQVAEHIGSDDFAPRLAAFKAAEPTPNGDGDGEGGESTGSQEPGAGGFGGPSPGNDSGSQPMGTKDPVVVGSPEYSKLLEDPKAYEQAVKDNRIVDASPTYR